MPELLPEFSAANGVVVSKGSVGFSFLFCAGPGGTKGLQKLSRSFCFENDIDL